MHCFCCTNEAICHLKDKSEIGWCERCAECTQCSDKKAYRVSWSINGINLYNNVCHPHSLELEHSLKHDVDAKLMEYVYE